MEDSGRRAFFREALAGVVRPLADYLEQRIPSPVEPPQERPRLRPPGAIPEATFIDTCRRCGACVEACPANAIFPLPESFGYAPRTPVIDPDYAACVVCEGLQCTHVCPSGALLPLSAPTQIRMGLAEVYRPLCVRSRGESCTQCVERCPMGETALRFIDAGPPEVLAGCVGCGVCQLYCPTSPKAIVVQPLPA
ncbi:MAG: 4Fe-4S dicluster domain-containing protein [Planctomycetes bacterium]|nr:4Fe-4S dicluster domain-containing protein [Planctomycetota bacterium]